MVAQQMKRELFFFFPIFFFQFLASPENHVLFEKDDWRIFKKKFRLV